MSLGNQYNYMENFLKDLCGKKFTSLDKEETKKKNEIIHPFREEILKFLQSDPLFAHLYREPFYGGSFYDGLRVRNPDFLDRKPKYEFDIDLLMEFPADQTQITLSNQPGFVFIKFLTDDNLFDKILTNDYLDTEKIRTWMQSLFTSALNRHGYFWAGYQIKFRPSDGPACPIEFWLDDKMEISIDFVFCCVFENSELPRYGFKNDLTINNSTDEFLAIPKKPPFLEENQPARRYWRLSFQKQERALMHKLERFKPALRILKKFRDTQDLVPIKSYYLKTLGLWMIHERRESLYWLEPTMSSIFMDLLNRFQKALESGTILYFWSTTRSARNNLLRTVDSTFLESKAVYLKRIIVKVQNEAANYHAIQKPCIADYILTKSELLVFDNTDEVPGDDEVPIKAEVSNALVRTSWRHQYSSADEDDSEDDESQGYRFNRTVSRMGCSTVANQAENDGSAAAAAIVGAAVGIGALAIAGVSAYRAFGKFQREKEERRRRRGNGRAPDDSESCNIQ